jgi:hypothetical protein
LDLRKSKHLKLILRFDLVAIVFARHFEKLSSFYPIVQKYGPNESPFNLLNPFIFQNAQTAAMAKVI